MSTLSTHVLDTSLGRPASGVRVLLERVDATGSVVVGGGTTDPNGRLTDIATTQLPYRRNVPAPIRR
jgi:5-hydroxyisourate hydrolase